MFRVRAQFGSHAKIHLTSRRCAAIRVHVGRPGRSLRGLLVELGENGGEVCKVGWMGCGWVGRGCDAGCRLQGWCLGGWGEWCAVDGADGARKVSVSSIAQGRSLNSASPSRMPRRSHARRLGAQPLHLCPAQRTPCDRCEAAPATSLWTSPHTHTHTHGRSPGNSERAKMSLGNSPYRVRSRLGPERKTSVFGLVRHHTKQSM